ncbi:hypothetical protein FRC09_009789 [Ceratobasidium sp. 395]|nr:hypothetical protein FRC09_009789 [Ceratobasidium sp. 395]
MKPRRKSGGVNQMLVVRCDQPEDRHLYQQLQVVLTSARRVTVVCGAGISTSAGIPDFRSADGLYNQPLSGVDRSFRASELFAMRTLCDPDKLRAYGRVVAGLRIAARNARPTACHNYIAKLHDAGRLARCYTQNVDGLQTGSRPDMGEVVLELHGNIKTLSCNRCRQTPDQDAQALDQLLLQNGCVQCRRCPSRGGRRSIICPVDMAEIKCKGKRFRRLPPGLLLPEILHNEDSREIQSNGLSLDELERSDGSASLLLVIGTSIKTDGAAKLVKSLSRKVHDSGGAVVYIDRGKLAESTWARYFDVQLRTDIDMWAEDACYHLSHPKPKFECLGYVVVLCGQAQLACHVPGDRAGYQLIVIHLTDYILRLGSDWQAPEPDQGLGQLLQRSARALRQLSERSEHSTVLMVSAEDELLDETRTSSLERLFRGQSVFKSAIASLNLSRFKTRNWVDFVIAIASSYHQSVLPPLEYMASQWMRCGELFLRSDLVVFTRSAPTTMLLASDLSSRPMGRPLPNLAAVCACKLSSQGAERKPWEVVCRAVRGCLAKEFEVTVRCGHCRECWELDTSKLSGRVIAVGEKHCVAIGYNLADGWI